MRNKEEEEEEDEEEEEEEEEENSRKLQRGAESLVTVFPNNWLAFYHQRCQAAL